MNWMSLTRLTALLGLAFATPLSLSSPVAASEFTETAIDQSQVIAVAVPYGVETRKYNLYIFEQIPNKRQCWQTSGQAPRMVDALLTQFDFTGHCRRATDSNGYSMRIDGQDFGLDYLLRVVPRGNELVLVATSRTGRGPEIVLGRSQGLSLDSPQLMQLRLNPGWQFTKRTYQGKMLGHYYISGSQSNIVQEGTTTGPAPVQPDSVQPEVPAIPEPDVDLESQLTPPPLPVTEEVEIETPEPVQELEFTTTPALDTDEANVADNSKTEITDLPPGRARSSSPTPDDFRRF